MVTVSKLYGSNRVWWLSKWSIIDLDKNEQLILFCHGGSTLSTCKQCKIFLIHFISLMEMETFQNCSDSEAVVATCSLGIIKLVADDHLLLISASEYLLHFVNI